ncbi:TPA: hypothetical protein OCF48_004059 [Escherichia coli]|nr:hypothetical protein [Escherichia coli]WJW20267.1 hypothetical protein QVM98_10400 [Escherichia coli]BDO94924.1 hypothetical protein TUM9812_20120 [Escherichia coli]HCO9937049.1 hypothetical protein [Escherichia coli]
MRLKIYPEDRVILTDGCIQLGAPDSYTSVITLGGEQDGTVLVPGRLIIGGGAYYPSGPLGSIRRKLRPENRVNLGSVTELGVVFPTGTTHSILEVINGYLKDSLTVDELSFILEHREKFVFSLGVGDRRDSAALVPRFTYVDNWHGDDVTDFVLLPEVYSRQAYRHRLWFDGTAGTIRMTDEHSGGGSRYGSLRALVIREA